MVLFRGKGHLGNIQISRRILYVVTGVGLRQCTLGLRPYMGNELAMVRSHKCREAGRRRRV